MKTTLNTSALVTADSPKGQRATETFRAQYNKAGLNNSDAQILNEHPGFATYLLTGIRRFSTKAPDYMLAQSILGADFITPEDVSSARPNIAYTDEQITALAESLPSEDVLKWYKDHDYALMPAPSTAMSMLDVRDIQPYHFYRKTSGWCSDQKFASEDKTSFGWLAIRKTLVPNSTYKKWKEQSKLLSTLERVPNVAEMSWFLTTYFEVRGTRLFESIYVRTSSINSEGDHVKVGSFDSQGIYIYDWDVDRSSGADLGVSSARSIACNS